MTLNIKKTHSERLMPLVDRLLVETGLEREELDAVAASAGPGSFTGLRIGVSTARALAQGLGIPAVPVSTLSALAEAVPAPGTLICPILDARRSQVYTGLFKRSAAPPYQLETVFEPAAIALSELIEVIASINCSDQAKGTPASSDPCPGPDPKAKAVPVVFVGEGLHSYAADLEEALPFQAIITPAPFRLCRAALVALRGRALLEQKPQASYLEVLPRYLRSPEAERKAAKKEGEGGFKP